MWDPNKFQKVKTNANGAFPTNVHEVNTLELTGADPEGLSIGEVELKPSTPANDEFGGGTPYDTYRQAAAVKSSVQEALLMFVAFSFTEPLILTTYIGWFIFNTTVDPQHGVPYPAYRIYTDLGLACGMLLYYVLRWWLAKLKSFRLTVILVTLSFSSTLVGSILYLILPHLPFTYMGVGYVSLFYPVRFFLLNGAVKQFLLVQLREKAPGINRAISQLIATSITLTVHLLATSGFLQVIMYNFYPSMTIRFNYFDAVFYTMMCLINGPTFELVEDRVSSRLVVMYIIMGTFLFIPGQIRLITKAFNKVTPRAAPKYFQRETYNQCVYIFGNITLTSVRATLKACHPHFESKRYFIIDNLPASADIVELISEPCYKGKVWHLERPACDFALLEELKVQPNDLIFIITDYDAAPDPEAWDLASIAKAITICEYFPPNRRKEIKIFLQLILHSSVEHVIDYTNLRILCMDDVLVALMAKNCAAPGYATLVQSLVWPDLLSSFVRFCTFMSNFYDINNPSISLLCYGLRFQPVRANDEALTHEQWLTKQLYMNRYSLGRLKHPLGNDGYSSVDQSLNSARYDDLVLNPPNTGGSLQRGEYLCLQLQPVSVDDRLPSKKHTGNPELLSEFDQALNHTIHPSPALPKECPRPACFPFIPLSLVQSSPLSLFSDHVIICDFRADLKRYTMPLINQLRLAFNQPSLTVVVMVPTILIGNETLELPNVHVVRGPPYQLENLHEAGITTAKRVVILHEMVTHRSGPPAVVLLEKNIDSLNPTVPIIKRFPCGALDFSFLSNTFDTNRVEIARNGWHPFLTGMGVFTDVFYYGMLNLTHTAFAKLIHFPCCEEESSVWHRVLLKDLVENPPRSHPSGSFLYWFVDIFKSLATHNVLTLGATYHNPRDVFHMHHVIQLCPTYDFLVSQEGYLLLLVPRQLDLTQVKLNLTVVTST